MRPTDPQIPTEPGQPTGREPALPGAIEPPTTIWKLPKLTELRRMLEEARSRGESSLDLGGGRYIIDITDEGVIQVLRVSAPVGLSLSLDIPYVQIDDMIPFRFAGHSAVEPWGDGYNPADAPATAAPAELSD